MGDIIRIEDVKRLLDERRAALAPALAGIKFELMIWATEMGGEMRAGKVGDHIKDAIDHLNQALELLEEQ